MWSCSQIMHQWKKEGKLHCISLLGQFVFTLEVTQKLIHMQNFKFVICYLFTAITICHLSNYFAGPGVTISFHNFRCLELKWGNQVHTLCLQLHRKLSLVDHLPQVHCIHFVVSNRNCSWRKWVHQFPLHL